MKISYDLAALPERRRGLKESEEVTAIKAFLAGKQKNMCFEYDDKKEAKRRYDSVRNFRLQHKLQEVSTCTAKTSASTSCESRRRAPPAPPPAKEECRPRCCEHQGRRVSSGQSNHTTPLF